MNENKTALLKIFSAVLKDRVKSEPQYQSISTEMVKHFSRKELIEIITHNFEGEVPSEFNLVEMENNELLQLIGDDFKTARKHLLDHLEGNIAWKSPEQAIAQKERLRKKKEQGLIEPSESVINQTEYVAIEEIQQEEESPAFSMSMGM